eukprot:12089453-Prorocentrum_lima.AAC.1
MQYHEALVRARRARDMGGETIGVAAELIAVTRPLAPPEPDDEDMDDASAMQDAHPEPTAA